MIHGVPVIGACEDVPRILADSNVQEVLFSSAEIAPERCIAVERACSQLGCAFRRMRITLE